MGLRDCGGVSLKPMCIETVNVVKEAANGLTENKAWTDRVWEESDYGDTKPTHVNYIKKTILRSRLVQ